MDLKNLYNRVSKIINSSSNFLIITHTYPDGDSMGSQVALYQLIKALNKKVTAVCVGELPYQYKFLPHFNEIKKNPDAARSPDERYVCFCLDCADEGRMNLDFDRVKEISKLVINIDHHNNNTNFGDINVVDTEKSATAEILYELINRNYRELLDNKIAMGIYVGILTDTGNFQYSNTNHNVHRVTSELLKFNLNPAKIHKYIYESEPLARFKLIQLVIERIGYIESSGLIYSYILQKDFEKLKLPFSAQDGLINLLRSAEKVKIAALIKQAGKDSFRISLRTSDSRINLYKIASSFDGGGHRMAAAYSDSGSIKDVIKKLIYSVENGKYYE